MVTYPVHVAREGYRGTNPRRREQVRRYNEDAQRIEECINAMLEEQTEATASYTWHEISSRCGLSPDRIREIGFSIDGGHNGFTALRKGTTWEQAQQEARD